MTTTYAIQDLCLQPYWMQETRSELYRVSQLSSIVDPESLPLLDAFIQESMRVNPSDAISGRRKAIEPFRFSDGLLVKAGDWVCLPQQAMLRDERLYPQPACFNPTRFLRRQKVQDLWPVWGLGNATCPGRFYASLAMKLVLMHILQYYNCKLLDRQAPRTHSWRSSILPRSSSLVLFRKRRKTFSAAPNGPKIDVT
ncbi:MAG: hypothetical protein L6R35_001351 [Caloplaca aegaea]|nr:MAG: hypothetical protein L6R35_001351 [Caloplaca aegaea]